MPSSCTLQLFRRAARWTVRHRVGGGQLPHRLSPPLATAPPPPRPPRPDPPPPFRGSSQPPAAPPNPHSLLPPTPHPYHAPLRFRPTPLSLPRPPLFPLREAGAAASISHQGPCRPPPYDLSAQVGGLVDMRTKAAPCRPSPPAIVAPCLRENAGGRSHSVRATARSAVIKCFCSCILKSP